MEHSALVEKPFLKSSFKCAINTFLGHNIDKRRIVGNLFGELHSFIDKLFGREDLKNAIYNFIKIFTFEMRPRFNASSALIRSPVKHNSIAKDFPTARVRR
jgi:hypothetical protein